MSRDSPTELLVLHAVRITGFADAAALAHRFGLDPAVTEEFLGDAEAYGWVQQAHFADLRGWSLTAAGRTENERQLAAELTAAAELTGNDGRDEVAAVHQSFLPLNARLQRACTDWQLRPTAGDRFATNDHTDAGWDLAVLDELGAIGSGLVPLADRLEQVLTRFGGYGSRFDSALGLARSGKTGWVDRTDVDSCHRVWFELHEDLIATLGLDRGTNS